MNWTLSDSVRLGCQMWGNQSSMLDIGSTLVLISFILRLNYFVYVFKFHFSSGIPIASGSIVYLGYCNATSRGQRGRVSFDRDTPPTRMTGINYFAGVISKVFKTMFRRFFCNPRVCLVCSSWTIWSLNCFEPLEGTQWESTTPLSLQSYIFT